MASEQHNYAEIAFQLVEDLDALGHVQEVMNAFKKAVETLGLNSFIMTGLPLPNRPLDPLVLLNAWPSEWFKRYSEHDYFRRDPVGQYALTSQSPFLWRSAPKKQEGSHELMGEAREFGLVDGFCVPMFSPQGWQAVIALASDRQVDLSPRELAATHLMAIAAYGRVRALSGSKRLKQARLSPRELEVLAWIAAGKSAWETSCILSISEATVAHHMDNIRKKLHAVNTTQAVVAAIRLGELQPY